MGFILFLCLSFLRGFSEGKGCGKVGVEPAETVPCLLTMAIGASVRSQMLARDAHPFALSLLCAPWAWSYRLPVKGGTL